ncbi:DNA-methyltransferase [Gracilibacillus dipsosauri]|uniref:DNA-methyltransferase n=1 Tax=Gracilibacillus dipsosauri TaxID=178340 RepID=UPI0024097293
MQINQIYNMDCIKGMKKIDDESIDLIVTDPPYLIEYKTNYRKDKKHEFNHTILNDNNPELISKYIKECYRILKPNKAMYMFCNFDNVDFFKKELEKYFKIKNMIVWVKNNWTAGDLEAQFGKQYELIFLVNKGRAKFFGSRVTDVWHFNRIPADKLIHQNQEPLDLIKRCILKHSQVGDLVFDGFMGSGTTAVAAIDEKRNFLGFELDYEKYEKASKRIKESLEFQQLTLF